MRLPTLRLLSSPTNAAALRAELAQISPQAVLPENIEKGSFYIFRLDYASTPLARFLFQELTMEGGHVVLAPGIYHGDEKETNLLLMGTRYQLRRMLSRLRTQRDAVLDHLAEEIAKSFEV